MDVPRLVEVIPTFTKEEKNRFLKISSLDFNEFYSAGDPRQCSDKHILFKGNRVLEDCYERLSKLNVEDSKIKEKLFKVMLKWGHIALLAQDWAKALSSYEYAYRLLPEDFWKDPGGYYGLGLVYIHFKEYKRAAEAFLRLLYAYPTLDQIVEVKVRLGVCYQNLSDYSKALKYYGQALSDEKDSPFMSRVHVRFNVAVTKENAGDLSNSEDEYKKILNEVNNLSLVHGPQFQHFTESQMQLMAAVNRHLGWICYRQPYAEGATEERNRKLHEAVQFLHTATQFEQFNGKTFYLFGRCYGEMPHKAHDAFVNYRHSIDKSEADADTWCSIGWLYQQQQQPMDALQAFICAVELDAEHSAAWTDLGRLYELHNQFEDALSCFRKAVKYKPAAPEALKARILVLEKELQTSSHLVSQKAPQSHAQHNKSLPSLKEAWNQPIPSELRGRQDEFLKVKQQRYREGSPLWKMGELSAPLGGLQECPGAPSLDQTQVQIMKLLQINKERINEQEKNLLSQMESIHKAHLESSYDSFYSSKQVAILPKFTDRDITQIKEGGHLALPASVKIETDCDDVKDVKPEQGLEIVHHKSLSTIGLPSTFSLEAKLNVSIDISSSELLEICSKRVEHPTSFKHVFDENVAPPQPPPAPTTSKVGSNQNNPLLRPTPLIVVESRKDAQSVELQKYCENCPIALIRGMTSVLKMDLSLFSTKTLRETAPDHEVEVRTQYRMPCDLNVDHLGVPTWECMSTRSFTSVNKYAQYQAETFQHSLKEEAEKLRSAGAKYAQQIAESSSAKKRRGPNGDEFAMPLKMIKFGTNVDLSDESKWKPQLHELAKMPPFCRLIAGSNMLSHLGHTVLGMNTVQLYMKVPGSRTPAHQENNSFASVNINIGPGDCEWFGVPHEYWGVIERLCRKKGIDFLKGSFWPNVDDLLAENIPIYRFTQKAGDLVWVGGGCIHWVQATGWCNNIAWNVGPITYSQLSLSVSSYEWNKLQGYKSLVPMQHICWQLAKNIRFTNQKIFCFIKSQLIRSLAFCKMVADYAMSQGKQLKPQPRTKDEVTHYCTLCEVEVFNILFVKEHNGKFPVYCVYCARRTDLTDFLVLQQIPFSELSRIFDEMQLNLIPKAQLVC
ncbi:unnamed protein product [Auanema sp. JU1783]|nr:unnamed protein product [Auanema sp. JU1783]